MEPTRAATPDDDHLEAVGIISRMMFLGFYDHIDELTEGYPYEVAVVDRWNGNSFLVHYKSLLDEFRILKIPRGCHETFTKFLERKKTNNIQNCYIAYVGLTDDREPVLKAHGGGFHVYMS
jgi:hypothetical protein